MLKDFLAGVRNVAGGRSAALQKKMRHMRNTVLSELEDEALANDANAVIAIKIDFDEYSEGMLMLSATGTAVKVSEAKAQVSSLETTEQLYLFQRFIHYPLKLDPGPFFLLGWNQGCPDPTLDSYQLTVWASGQRFNNGYSREDLLGGDGSEAWEDRLRQREREMVPGIKGEGVCQY